TLAECSVHCSVLFFFFQAEDGIRDFHVTGVQTCALPISARDSLGPDHSAAGACAMKCSYRARLTSSRTCMSRVPLVITTKPNLRALSKNIELYSPYADPVCPTISTPGIRARSMRMARP